MARALRGRAAAIACATALVGTGAGLAACGDGGPRDATRVSVQVFGDPEELAVFRRVADAYRERTGREVRLLEVGDRKDHLARLVAASASGRLPDAFLLNHRVVGAFAARGVLDPVGPRLGATARGYFPIALDAFRLGGAVQCLPQNVSSLVVYFNRDLFRRAGVPLPRVGWTYDDFLAAARRLTGDGRFGVAIEPNTIRMAPFVWGAGGEVFDDPEHPTRFTLDTPAARRGLQALADLRRSGVAPERRENEALAPDERFLGGELGMFLSSRRDVPTLRAIRDFDWDVAPFPVLERPVSVLHSDGLCLARGPRADAAWAFVRFALGPEGQRILARGGRTVPSLRSVARSADFLAVTPPRSNEVFLDQVHGMRRLPTTAGFARVEEAADTVVEELYYGRLSIDAAIRRLQAETAGAFG